MPYIESLRIDQEDSLSLENRGSSSGSFRVGVIRLPHMSNYTDFNALETVRGVTVGYLAEPSAPVDLLIIPGTKNTIHDLRWLRQSGFEHYIADHVARRTWVVGICGGYQMLGTKISDPFHVEEGGSIDGLGFLPVETELGIDKITVQSHGYSFLGAPVSGYEIHMGRTQPSQQRGWFIRKGDGTDDGLVSGCIAGTYFHGIFDNADFTRKFLARVAEDRGLYWRPEYTQSSKEDEYDRLAQIVREHIDIDRIYEWIQQ